MAGDRETNADNPPYKTGILRFIPGGNNNTPEEVQQWSRSLQPPAAADHDSDTQTTPLIKRSFLMPIFVGSNALKLNHFIREYTPTKTPYSKVGPLIYIKKDRSRLGFPTLAAQQSQAVNEGDRILEETKEKFLKRVVHESDVNNNELNKTSQWKTVFADCADQLRQVALDYNFTYGGWFETVRWDKIDELYSRLGHSLISGPLKNTLAHSVRVTTEGHPRLPRGMHIICVLVPNSFDKEACKQVFDVLVRHHGWVPEGCKPDLFLELNLTHIHQSREYSCTFVPGDFSTQKELQEAKFTLAPRRITRSASPFFQSLPETPGKRT
ncbi:hypothetical protein AA313_de0206607 [Arthrobotrys entomopaga]|nr:hypothetical protein AA313_de0206607 [Arthrobotrys entomopaga]